MSAASCATSTAVITEMPTSAACSDGRVVDAVAHEADDVPAALQREDDAVLLRRRDAREDGRLLGHVPERRVVDARRARRPCTICWSSSPTCRQTCRATSSLSPVRILTVHAVALELARARRRRPAATGSAKLTKPARTRSASSSREYAARGVQPAVGDREHAETVRAQSLVDRRARLLASPRRAARPARRPRTPCSARGRFRRALGDQQPAARRRPAPPRRPTGAGARSRTGSRRSSDSRRRRPRRAEGSPRRAGCGCRSRSGC